MPEVRLGQMPGRMAGDNSRWSEVVKLAWHFQASLYWYCII